MPVRHNHSARAAVKPRPRERPQHNVPRQAGPTEGRARRGRISAQAQHTAARTAIGLPLAYAAGQAAAAFLPNGCFPHKEIPNGSLTIK